MKTGRILAALIALIVLCGPLCALPLVMASAKTTENCHSKNPDGKGQTEIHTCCQAGVVSSAQLSFPHTSIFVSIAYSRVPSLSGYEESGWPDFNGSISHPDPISTRAILRI
jgi:hypothetical protein